MSSDSDTKPSSTPNRGHWVLLGVFGGLFLLFFFFATLVIQAIAPEPAGENQIGVIEIVGPIMSPDQTLKDLDAFLEDENIKGILIRIDSPGGAVGASQEIYAAVQRAAKKKKLAVSMGNVAASGGFYIAVAARPIFANSGTVAGSIGVISQTFEAHELMAFLKLEVNTIKSDRFKDAGSPFRDFTPEDRAVYQGLVKDIYDQFVTAVYEARSDLIESKGGMTEEAFRASTFVDGRVFTGAAAYKAGLVDELGGMQAAIDHLSKELSFEGKPTLVYPKAPPRGILGTLLSEGASSVRHELNSRTTPTFEYRYAAP